MLRNLHGRRMKFRPLARRHVIWPGPVGLGPLPSVTLVIPAHEQSSAFTACLRAVKALDPQPAETIVVVDGALEAVGAEASSSGARVIMQSPRSGPAASRNTGAAASAGEVLLFLDSDVTPTADLVRRVAHELAARPDVAAVIGSYDDDPSARNLPSSYVNLRHHYFHQRARTESHTFWGACGAVRRSAFERVGGFDERYRSPSVEDIELGHRLRQEGSQIRMVKDLHVRHLKRWEVGSLLRTEIVSRALPWSALILRTGRIPNDLNTSAAERLKAVLAVGVVLSALTAVRWPPALIGSAVMACSVVVADRGFIRLLARRRGLRVALGGTAWHLAHHFYSGVAFGVAAVRHLVVSVVRGGAVGSSSALPPLSTWELVPADDAAGGQAATAVGAVGP